MAKSADCMKIERENKPRMLMCVISLPAEEKIKPVTHINSDQIM